MKRIEKIIIVFICILLLTGCGSNPKKGIVSQKSVNDIINSQTASTYTTTEATTEITTNISENDTSFTETTENSTEQGIDTEENSDNSDVTSEDTSENAGDNGGVDYDLTEMSSDMVYATVYQMMATPEEYEGKTFRIDGTFYATYYEPTGKYYFYCIIQDALACCTQGLEFVWGDGSHVYPDDYPEDNAEIVVEGTFETYEEDDDRYLYCRLRNATMGVINN